MHEWALAEGVVTTVLETAKREKLDKITRVVIKIGELQRIQKDFFHDAIRQVMPPSDPVIGSATIELEIQPVRFRCRPCDHRFGAGDASGELSKDDAEAIHFIPELAHTFLSCPRCHSPDFEVIEGRGVVLHSLEGE